MSGTVFGAPIFLFLGTRKGDRSLLLVLPLIASIIVIGLIPIVLYQVVAASVL